MIIKNLDVLLAQKILHQESKLLTAPGENYGSIMTSLTVRTPEKQLNLVAKLIPTNEMLKEIFQVQITFIKELNVYLKIVPAFRQLEEEHNIRKNRASDLFCKCYGGRNNLENNLEGPVDENAVILLENLKISGYETGDRLRGFDYQTSVVVLENLARIHATAIALKILHPDIFNETIDETIKTQSENRGNPEKILTFTDGLFNVLKQDPNLIKYAEKFIANLKYVMEEGIFQKGDPKLPFVTFSHADFWVNNMMVLRSGTSESIKLKIVDFQTAAHQSIACDLLFFMYSSISPDVLYSQEDEFFSTYYASFISTLESFQIDLKDYSWDLFNVELRENASFVLNQIMFMYKVILMERGKISNLDDFTEDDMFDFSGVSDDCKRRMRMTFESFIRRGWLDNY